MIIIDSISFTIRNIYNIHVHVSDMHDQGKTLPTSVDTQTSWDDLPGETNNSEKTVLFTVNGSFHAWSKDVFV